MSAKGFAGTAAMMKKMGVLTPPPATDVSAALIKPTAWHSSKHQIDGTFTALNDEWLYGVPPRFLASRADRLAMFNRIVTACGGESVASDEKMFRRQLRLLQPQIPINMLEHPADFGFGRETIVDPGHVGVIVTYYDDDKFNVSMMLIWRQFDAAGNLADVHFVLYDGWHSSRVRIEQEYASCPEDLWHGRRFISLPVCNIKPVENVEQAAAAFASINGQKDRKKTSSKDDWRHRVLQNDSRALAVVQLASECGLNAECVPNAKGYPHLGPATILEKLLYGTPNITSFDYVDELDVRRALMLLGDKENIGLHKSFAEAKKAQFIGGLCLFVTFVERPGFAHAVAVRYMLSRPDFMDRLNQICSKISKDTAAKTLEPFIPADALQERDEPMRYLFIAAALTRYYKELVAAPKSRHQLWTDCPMECKRLFYDALIIKDERDRGKFIADQQKALGKLKNMPKAYCPAPRALGKPLTR